MPIERRPSKGGARYRSAGRGDDEQADDAETDQEAGRTRGDLGRLQTFRAVDHLFHGNVSTGFALQKRRCLKPIGCRNQDYRPSGLVRKDDNGIPLRALI